MQRILFRTSGFTLIELIVGMLIFSIGMTAILALLHSTIKNSLTSRHEIVAANLLREELELLKNIRNTNVRNFIPYDSAKISGSAVTGFASGVYIVENNYSQTGITIRSSDGKTLNMPILMKQVDFSSLDNEERFNKSQLYLDSQERFTHTVTSSPTLYASYVIIHPLEFQDEAGNTLQVQENGKNQGYIIDARVLVKSRGYIEYDLKSIITDWKK